MFQSLHKGSPQIHSISPCLRTNRNLQSALCKLRFEPQSSRSADVLLPECKNMSEITRKLDHKANDSAMSGKTITKIDPTSSSIGIILLDNGMIRLWQHHPRTLVFPHTEDDHIHRLLNLTDTQYFACCQMVTLLLFFSPVLFSSSIFHIVCYITYYYHHHHQHSHHHHRHHHHNRILPFVLITFSAGFHLVLLSFPVNFLSLFYEHFCSSYCLLCLLLLICLLLILPYLCSHPS